MTARWTGTGPVYQVEWGGQAWSLDVASDHPGLIRADRRLGPLLSLDGLSARGRDPLAGWDGSSLVDAAIRFDRVEAVYVLEDWDALRIRAAWTAREADIIDLEVQIQAYTVDRLKEVTVQVSSRFGSDLRVDFPREIVARVIDPAALTPAFYLEMIHPDDRVNGPAVPILPTTGQVRRALFGHDLEKGVVLRGRLRGVWVAGEGDEAEVERRVGAFFGEPLPLGP